MATFTRDDQLYAQAYLSNRAILYQLWDLALIYPNVASKIRVRVRKADPDRDYRYDENGPFADSAIVVSLSWAKGARACEFLNCNGTYAANTRCKIGDEPRVIPSGDRTSVTACQPACFMITETNGRKDRAEIEPRYRSDSAYVMLAKDGNYVRRPVVSQQQQQQSSASSHTTGKRRYAGTGVRPYERSMRIG